MSSYQTLMVIGSLFILSTLTLSFYNTNTEQLLSSTDNEAIIASTGIAQSILDEIQTRSFDEFTTTKPTTATDSLTSAFSLGPESGETSSNQFDDIDDYNGYSENNTDTRLGSYNVAVDVGYVTFANPSTFTNSRSFTKRINVKVYGQYMSDTLSMSHIVAY